MNQIINMVIRIIMRKAINSGINAGMGAFARRGGNSTPQQPMSDDARGQPQVQASAKQAQKMARITRRVTRL